MTAQPPVPATGWFSLPAVVTCTPEVADGPIVIAFAVSAGFTALVVISAHCASAGHPTQSAAAATRARRAPGAPPRAPPPQRPVPHLAQQPIQRHEARLVLAPLRGPEVREIRAELPRLRDRPAEVRPQAAVDLGQPRRHRPRARRLPARPGDPPGRGGP